jgi:hypothetical protein
MLDRERERSVNEHILYHPIIATPIHNSTFTDSTGTVSVASARGIAKIMDFFHDLHTYKH